MTTDESLELNISEPVETLKKAATALQSQDLATAIEIAEAFVKEAPESPYGYMLLSVVSELSNERSQAITLMTKAHELDPECREYAEVLASLHTLSGNLADGLYFKKIMELGDVDPAVFGIIPIHMRSYEDALKNVKVSTHYIEAMRCYNMRDYSSCVDECVRELRHNNHHVAASELLGFALMKTSRPGRALASFQTAIHLAPQRAKLYAGLGEVLLQLGRPLDAAACLHRALEIDPDSPEIVARFQRAMVQVPGMRLEDLKKAADTWYSKILQEFPPSEMELDRQKGDKIRVGIVSDIFYSSDNIPYIVPFLENYDKSKIEIRLYSLCRKKDSVSSRLQNATETVRDIVDIDQYTLGETIRREKLDIAIDMCFEPDAQALELFNVKIAPIQVSWFEPFEGLSTLGMTHILTDQTTEVVDQVYISEGQVCLKPSNGILSRDQFSVYNTNLPSPVAENGYVMFGMRADLAGITPTDALATVNLMRAVPGSHLMLGLVNRLDAEVKTRLLELFSLGGIVDRVLFQELPDSQAPEQRRQDICQNFFADVDVFLSPSASCEFDDVALSLWMGAPVVAIPGSSRASRLPVSILHQANCSAWVAHSPQQFVEIGEAIANNSEDLATMRLTLRDDVKMSHLFDAPKVAREIWKSLLSICEG